MPTPGLQSHTVATRNAALEAELAELATAHKRKVRAAQRAIAEADVEQKAAEAEAREKVERTRRLRSEALAEELRAELAPLVAERRSQPSREVDRRLQTVIAEGNAKVASQVGGGIGASPALASTFVLTVFADALLEDHPGAMALFQAPDFGMAPGPRNVAAGIVAAAERLGPVAFGQVVDQVEAELEVVVYRCSYPTTDRVRETYEAKRRTVHVLDMQADVAAVTARYEAKARAEHEERSKAILKKQEQAGLIHRVKNAIGAGF